MAVAEITGVLKLPPVPSKVPALGAEYQLIVPEDDVAPNVTDPVPQRAAGDVPVMEGISFMVAVMAVLVAVVHVPAVAST